MCTYKNCEGWTRRDCLQLGLGMLAGGTFVDLLRARSLAATNRSTRAPSPPVPSLTHTGVAVAVLPVTLIDDDATVSKIVSQTWRRRECPGATP